MYLDVTYGRSITLHFRCIAKREVGEAELKLGGESIKSDSGGELKRATSRFGHLFYEINFFTHFPHIKSQNLRISP